MNKFSKIIISAAASTLALSSASSKEHVCAESLTNIAAIIGVGVSHSFDADQEIFGVNMEGRFLMASCSSIEGQVTAFGGYSTSDDYDFGSLNRDFTVKGAADTTTAGLKTTNANGLKIKSFGIMAQVGKNFCFDSEYANVRQRRGQDCLCSHANIGLGAVFLYDKFEAKKAPAVAAKAWVSSTAKDAGIGIAGSFAWSSETGSFAVTPEAGIFAQVWNCSKVTGYDGKASDQVKVTTDVTRSKFRPIIGAGIPVLVRVADNMDIIIKPSVLWTMRSIKDGGSDTSVAGLKDMLIENRASGSIGIGISYSQR